MSQSKKITLYSFQARQIECIKKLISHSSCVYTNETICIFRSARKILESILLAENLKLKKYIVIFIFHLKKKENND